MKKLLSLIIICIFSFSILVTKTYATSQESPARYPGGDVELVKFINENLQYPPKALKDSVEGRVVVKFLVGKDGKISDITIKKSLTKETDKEAIRLVKKLPNFIPSTFNGKSIDSYYLIPIIFKIKKEKGPQNYVESLPEFPGGMQAMLEYMLDNLKYPKSALERNVQGTVISKFIVTKTGKVDQITIEKSIDPDLDAEAIRLIKSFPDFTPGQIDGKPVDTWYTLPISFRLPVKANVTPSTETK